MALAKSVTAYITDIVRALKVSGVWVICDGKEIFSNTNFRTCDGLAKILASMLTTYAALFNVRPSELLGFIAYHMLTIDTLITKDDSGLVEIVESALDEQGGEKE